MTTPQADEQTKRNRDDYIPVTDVPAFGTQLRFTKRVMQQMLAQIRGRGHSNGSTKKA